MTFPRPCLYALLAACLLLPGCVANQYAIKINAITNGERMGGQAWDVPVTFGSLSTAEEFEQYSKFVEGDLPLYTFDELKDSLYTYYNPDLDGRGHHCLGRGLRPGRNLRNAR